jgi:hypothetical protein
MRAGGGQGDADPAGGLDDPARDLEQVQPEGGELGNRQLMRPGGFCQGSRQTWRHELDDEFRLRCLEDGECSGGATEMK